jgi:hypothetical protein
MKYSGEYFWFFSQFVGKKGARIQGFKWLFFYYFIRAFSILSTPLMSLWNPERLSFLK